MGPRHPEGYPSLRVFLRPRLEVPEECEILWIEERLFRTVRRGPGARLRDVVRKTTAEGHPEHRARQAGTWLRHPLLSGG